MKILVTRSGSTRDFDRKLKNLGEGRWKEDVGRGVADAGRRTKTAVQKAVAKQMNVASYTGHVVANTRGRANVEAMTFEIFGVRADQDLGEFRGLRVLARGSRAGGALNEGRSADDRGQVRSGVWGSPRIFKRSFADESSDYFGGRRNPYFALLPAHGQHVAKVAPRALWTFGRKDGQARDEAGRFAKTGIKYGKARRLYGPSLRKELVKGESLATFHRVGREQLRANVAKRLKKHI